MAWLKRITEKILPVIILLALLAGAADAFHEGGPGACEACHSMHSGSAAAGTFLLKGIDPGSICLNCHEGQGDLGPTGYHVSTSGAQMPPGIPPKQRTPGGDFGWLRKDFNWLDDALSPPQNSPGERHGHNIIAIDYLYLPDSVNLTAPGGTYPANSLTCISCHDPHGRYRRDINGSITTSGLPIIGSGSYADSPDPAPGTAVGVYRMLAGMNYEPKSIGVVPPFTSNPPIAVAPVDYNRSESSAQTRVAYGSGMSEWCLNCHPGLHRTYLGRTNFNHPADDEWLSASALDSYNSYVKTGDLTGTQATSFLSLVPFEEATISYTVLKTHAQSDGSYPAGPESTSAQIMCLTCHRAHASGWDGITRWNTATDYIVFNGAYSQEGQAYQPYGQGRSELEASGAYYDIPPSMFAPNQDSLCFKCHSGGIP